MSEDGQRIYRTEADWREIIARQANSGLTGGAFCKTERINPSVFYRWRRELSGAVQTVKPRAHKAANPFVDLGLLQPSSGTGRFEVRLDLGAGMVLSVVRS